MKATGIIRRVDDLGRIVLPKELRQTMGIRAGDPMEIYTDADNIILRKYAPGCAFCGSVDGVRYIHDVPMCAICANNMQMLYRTAAGRGSE
jgi:transcriptional pleiotropic regulator of transition state genes